MTALPPPSKPVEKATRPINLMGWVAFIGLFYASFIATTQFWGLVGLIVLLPLLVSPRQMRDLVLDARRNNWAVGTQIALIIATVTTGFVVGVITTAALLSWGWQGIALGLLWIVWLAVMVLSPTPVAQPYEKNSRPPTALA